MDGVGGLEDGEVPKERSCRGRSLGAVENQITGRSINRGHSGGSAMEPKSRRVLCSHRPAGSKRKMAF